MDLQKKALLPQLKSGLEISLVSQKNKGLTITEAVKGTSLMRITKENGPEICQAVVMKLIKDLSDLCRQKFTEDEVGMFAASIRENYPEIKIEEIIYTLKKGVLGGYGKVYGQINILTINEWFEASYQEFIKEFEAKRIEEKAQCHTIETLKFLNPEVKKKVTEFANKSREEEKKINITLNPDEQSKFLNNKIQIYMTEFDKIYKESGRDIGGVRFVEVDGQILNCEAFVLFRLDE